MAAERIGDVVVERGDDHVATVTIDRPPDNYFDVTLIAALADAYEQLDDDPACRAIVLRSEGRHFCAGARFGGRAVASDVPGREPSSLYDEAIRLFAAATPVVAAVRGAAIGGGLGLAMSADFRVGSAETRMSANFARLGFHHGFALTVTLPGAIGQQRANELLLTGRRVPGDQAHAMGLLDRLVDAQQLDAEAHSFAAEIAQSAPLAVVSIRATMRASLVDRVRAATAHERTEQDRLMRTSDFAEGVAATAARRPPMFEGR
ncbi:MAG: short chain 3-hydroxyacyl-CoA dehydrogenase / enoyl-CoA hydratase [Ilumatobacteraceae bacterium]|nr:short chain 3-hydroxyacyl-CoA dehydrogenase / enoyl-CoA hydratase [Ilumatobacteraceae bacterium]